MIKTIKDILQMLFSRCYLLYLIVFLCIFYGVDHQRVIFKTLDAFPRAEKDVVLQAQGKKVLKDFVLWDAIRYYKNILALIPESSIAQSLVGFCYYHADEYEQALHYYQKAVEMDDAHFGLYYNLGVIHFQRQEYFKAIQNFQKVLAVSPKPTLSYVGLVSPFDHQSEQNPLDFREARTQMLKQTYSWTYRYLVLSYAEKQDYQQVLKRSLLALRNDMIFKDFFYYYATIASYELQDYPTALKYASLTIKENQEFADAYHYLGMSFKKMDLEGLSQDAFAQEQTVRKRLEGKEVQPQEELNTSLFLYIVNAKQEFFKQQRRKELLQEKEK